LRIWGQPQAKLGRSSLENRKLSKGMVVQVVDYLPSKHRPRVQSPILLISKEINLK
jgi:hypothetical protein